MQSARGCTETKECSFAARLLLTYNLTKQIVMADRACLSHFLGFCVAIKHFTSEGIHQL
jgi:hypothetical protein